MNIRRALVVPVTAAAIVGLAACGSDSDSNSAATAQSCPSAAPDHADPNWTLAGTTGRVAVTGSTATTAPQITVTTPFTVSATQAHVIKPGDGAEVTAASTVNVCYAGVDGRTGKTFDSSYERGVPAPFPVNGVVPGFQKALIGQRVGAVVAVAMTSADGYPEGNPDAGIDKGDTLVFELSILSAEG